MRFRRKQMIEVEATEHTRADCDLGGCDICLSYWELLDLMLPDGLLPPAADLPVQGEPQDD